MGSWLDLLMALFVLLNLALVVTSRLSRAVTITACEGVLLAALPPLVEENHWLLTAWIFALVIAVLKGVLIPRLLWTAIEKAGVDWEDEPFMGYSKALVVAAVAFMGCRVLSLRLPWPVPALSEFMVPVAFFVIFTGLFLIVIRQKAISQVIGYLQLETGIFIFGLAHPYQHSFMVEAAVLMDVLVAVMVMAIAIYQINRAFDHIDTNKLSTLRDYTR